jgi:hypothetical protein
MFELTVSSGYHSRVDAMGFTPISFILHPSQLSQRRINKKATHMRFAVPQMIVTALSTVWGSVAVTAWGAQALN